ncbi:cytochrome o ubiquinol oxidase subunit III [Dyella flagellata]|uniref:Cytochrome bo(3) ubiquinol oxidase subunit 3 n=1 Tax=Dyella flagellata TaxID=1867833 RepID=A0ABQ5X8S6_9GAMM|nr:cytochrome o ubiquinol oxidase subunit III [Dyella flagellata]GLQ88060.1 cytochrome o ubiquinol oxidase subunit III [Dyella flagellata]
MSDMTMTVGGGSGAQEALNFHVAEDHHPENATLLGFWLYLMSDCLIFACLFATYGVLGREYAGGPSAQQVLELPIVAVNTTLLLLSSITYGFAVLEMQHNRRGPMMAWLIVTWLLGAGFITLELTEFTHLVSIGAGPGRSAFLSSFFTLVGTHGLHVTSGLIWMIVLLVQVGKKGLIPANKRRLMCLSMFWHFLDVVWVGVFSFVYLMGVLA